VTVKVSEQVSEMVAAEVADKVSVKVTAKVAHISRNPYCFSSCFPACKIPPQGEDYACPPDFLP
jgi:hypothetical protein